MASLTGTKIKDTYDALLKVSDNGALDGTLQTITDGLGNNSALSLSTAGASVGGTLAVSGTTTLTSSATIQGGNSLLVNNAANTRSGSFKTSENGTELSSHNGAGEPLILLAPDASGYIYLSTAGSEKMRIQSGGDISFRDSSANEAFYWDASTASLGIGTQSPSTLLQLGDIDSQSENAALTVRRNGSGIEFGHNSRVSGYYGTIGALASAGTPYIAFSADNDEVQNTFTTRGFKGNVINSTINGDLTFNQLTNANASGQSLTERMRIAADGSVSVIGSLSKGSGSFKIDHPLEEKKDTHYLVHSFVESPQANNIYRGKVQLVNGIAQVNLDEVSTMTEGTFVALNRDIHTYTSNESDWDAVRGNVVGNILSIECQNAESNAIVSWLVIGERQDQHMMDTAWTDENGRVIVEPLKPEPIIVEEQIVEQSEI